MGKTRAPRPNLFMYIMLAVLTLAVYWQVTGFDFVQFDDDGYVASCAAVQVGLSKGTIAWAFTTPYQANYHPLTWISLMLDREVSRWASLFTDAEFGALDPRVFHVTNLLLHLANVFLLFAILHRVTGLRWRSAFVAALFAIHPQHVESVAWIAERKDVLSAFFWLLTMWTYITYTQRPSPKTFRVVCVVFILGLLTKPMLVSLPIMLLLMDIWPLGRLKMADVVGPGVPSPGPSSLDIHVRSRLIELTREKAALFALVTISCGLTFWAQRVGGAVATLKAYPVGVRFANASVAYVKYLVKMFWPTDLSILYRHPGAAISTWLAVVCAVIMLAITVFAVRSARRRPYIMVGWLWYLITMVPVIGLVQVGYQSMADRYTYIPFIGIFIMIAWGIPDLFARRGAEPGPRTSLALGVIGMAAVVALSVQCYSQVGYWRDGVTLFSHAIEIEPRDPNAHFNLGVSLNAAGRSAEAAEEYRKAINITPDYADAHYNLAGILIQDGNTNEAARELRSALRSNPDHTLAHANMGALLAQEGKYDEAIAHLRAALKIDPRNKDVLTNLKNAEATKRGEL